MKPLKITIPESNLYSAAGLGVITLIGLMVINSFKTTKSTTIINTTPTLTQPT